MYRRNQPAGQILARANFNDKGIICSASFHNVPAFVLKESLSAQIGGHAVALSIACGGAFNVCINVQPQLPGPAGFRFEA